MREVQERCICHLMSSKSFVAPANHIELCVHVLELGALACGISGSNTIITVLIFETSTSPTGMHMQPVLRVPDHVGSKARHCKC